MKRLVRLLRTIRHVRPHQLLSRASLMLRRKWNVRRAAALRTRVLVQPLPPLKPGGSLPLPLFPPRSNLALLEGDVYRITFLNESRWFTLPLDWHPPELDHGTRLWLLNLHYMEFLESLREEAVPEVIDDWIRRVPPYRDGYWMHDWNSYALSIRCVVWMQQYARHAVRWKDDFRTRMLTSLIHQIRFLERNLETDIGGNHVIKNIKALLWAGRFWNHTEAQSWAKKASTLLNRELDEQILDDGMHFERSPSYHAQVFADLLECYSLLGDGELKRHLYAKLGQMAQVLVDTTHPDGLPSLLNDGGLHMTHSPGTILDVWSRLSGEQVAPRREFALRSAGYFGARSEDEFILVDCGKVAPDHLTAHGHADILSFEWSILGHRMVVDPGVYEYNEGPRRTYARSTRSHNTVTLEGEDQCEFWGAFRMGRRPSDVVSRFSPTADGFVLDGSHDGFRHLPGSPRHKRTFEVRHGHIRVLDEVQGGNGQLVEARLLLHPECEVLRQPGEMLVRRAGIEFLLRTDTEVLLNRAVWFPDFGVETECTQFVLRFGRAPCRGSFELRWNSAQA